MSSSGRSKDYIDISQRPWAQLPWRSSSLQSAVSGHLRVPVCPLCTTLRAIRAAGHLWKSSSSQQPTNLGLGACGYRIEMTKCTASISGLTAVLGTVA